jgi:PHD/YefM family antitoxin component YafN of YafNO toxin-antitoxin module
MYTPPKTVSVTDLRTRTKDVIQDVLNSDEPVFLLYNSQMPIYLAPVKHLQTSMQHEKNTKKKLSTKEMKVRSIRLREFAQIFKGKNYFPEGGVAYQRKIRAEWDSDSSKK